MGAGQGGMTAQINFEGRGKPAQVEPFISRGEKCRFGQVHFPGKVLHPAFRSRLLENAYTCRIPLERLVRK